MDLAINSSDLIEIVPNKAYALGGTAPHHNLIHWIPKSAPGDAVFNSFVLTEGRRALVYDTSFPIFENAIKAQMRRFDVDDVKLVLSRVTEFDCVGNASLFVNEWPVSEVYNHFNANEWVYIRDQERAAFPPPYRSFVFEGGETIEISPGRAIRLISAKLKLLSAMWAYDVATRILFTSDSFCHVLAARPGVRRVTEETDQTSLDDVRRNMNEKFSWMNGANTEPIRRFLGGIFAQYEIEHIAPNLGCVISGRNLVKRHFEYIDQVLNEMDSGVKK